jgi:phosphatidylserine/phosphatidylglycerophosphate/cardiolipin synthase-like enzyme
LARFGLAYRRITGVIFCRRSSRRRSSPRRASRQRPANLQMVKAVETRWDIHEKVVIVDDEITWFGSLNPLSHQPHDEMMARLADKDTALQLSAFVARNINPDKAEGLVLRC